MTEKASRAKTGYTSREFASLFQLYSAQVYTGLFRDFSFWEERDCYRMAFREEAGKTPLITIEKRALGPEKSLFVALGPAERGQIPEIARSEKLDAFVDQLRRHIEKVKLARSPHRGSKVVSLRTN